MSIKNVGIIGNGFVGSATASGFALAAKVRVYDIDEQKRTHPLEEVVSQSDFVFICVPTPMRLGSGKDDVSIIRRVFREIKECSLKKGQVFIIKSTATPASLASVLEENNCLSIVFSPEFLTQRSARLDFINTNRIVLGGKEEDVDKVESLMRVRFPHTKIIKTDLITAQFTKYMANCFFATKVAFMNELRQAANALDVDWEKAMDGFVSDGRIGNSHLNVPGHDGKMGFGGKCFPKDLNAFIRLYEEIGVEPTIMRAVWKKNLEVREEKDWLDIPGATSGDKNAGK
jgi:UDPglucose 6-dehydrogenase